ncbi:MAG: methionyl-tRNA formyltransferase [Pseudomonadota bacterium]
MPLRLIFMGTPDFAVPALGAVLGSGHEVEAVYTRAPKPAGRGKHETKSPVHVFAEKNGLPVFTPASLKTDDELEQLRTLQPDVIVVVAYGMLLPQSVLDVPQFGCLNLHASLLPRWRGAAPIQRAIMAGDNESGVMVMKMEAGLDTGPVAMVEKTNIAADMTAGELHDSLARLGSDLLPRALSALERDALTFTQQAEDGVIYAKKIEKAESRIDWSQPAQDVHNHIRGLSPFPGAWFEYQGERIKVLRSRVATGIGGAGTVLDDQLTVACGGGAVQLITLQRAGKQPMNAEELLRGFSIPAGEKL